MSGMIPKHNPDLDWLIAWQASRTAPTHDTLIVTDLPEDDDDDAFQEVKIDKPIALVTDTKETGE